MGIFTTLHKYFNKREHAGPAPFVPTDTGEITQSIGTLELAEQLQIIQLVKNYLKEFTIPHVKLEPSWISGHEMLNEIFISQGESALMRCNVEAFFQNQLTGIRELVFLVSLVKFDGDRWCVFQVKEVKIL